MLLRAHRYSTLATSDVKNIANPAVNMPAGTTRKTSRSQPHHRRPAWARTEISYGVYIHNERRQSRSVPDYGMDNLSYDAGYLWKWQLPNGLAEHLPPQIREAAENWVYAGAAVDTALERVRKMENEAPDRANPVVTHTHLIRRMSEMSAVVGAEASPISSPVSPTPLKPTSFDKMLLMHPFTQRPTNIIGMESPPYTPVRSGSQASSTPSNGRVIDVMGTALPDPNEITAQLELCPLKSARESLTSLLPVTPVRNMNAWAHYVNTYNNELEDLRKNALMRLKGYARIIDVHMMEIVWEQDLSPETKAAVAEFETWWKVMEPKVSGYEHKVHSLHDAFVETEKEFEARTRGSSVCSLPV